MSTLELIKTQNEHRTNNFVDKGEDTKMTLRERYEATPTPEIGNPWEHIWKEVHKCSHI